MRVNESTNLSATGFHPDGFMRQPGFKKLLFLKLQLKHPSDGKTVHVQLFNKTDSQISLCCLLICSRSKVSILGYIQSRKLKILFKV